MKKQLSSYRTDFLPFLFKWLDLSYFGNRDILGNVSLRTVLDADDLVYQSYPRGEIYHVDKLTSSPQSVLGTSFP